MLRTLQSLQQLEKSARPVLASCLTSRSSTIKTQRGVSSSSIRKSASVLGLGLLCVQPALAHSVHHRAVNTNASMSGGASSLSYPAPIVLGPRGEHKATVIMLHGLGDTGDGWADIGQMFTPVLPNVKFIFPTAPRRPITLNWGMMMTGWYDIPSLEQINRMEDEQGLKESQRYIEGLIEQEVASGIPTSKVLVAGFSQGGAVSLLMLRSQHQLAGVIGLSTYLPLREEPPIISDANKQTPVLMCHGDADQVVAYTYGKQSYEKLQEAGCSVQFKTYPGMGHSACPQELEELKKFITEKLAS